MTKTNSIRGASKLVANITESGITSLQQVTDDVHETPVSHIVLSESPPEETNDAELKGLIPQSPHSQKDTAPNVPGLASAKPVKTPNVQRKAIKVTLEKTGHNGQYMVNTNDPELRSLLKQGFERSKGGEIQKKRSRFSDLAFTKQFTAFDRQNPEDVAPSFHGFFSLFWMGVTLMLVRLAANNWRAYGSVLGKNEIMRLMLSRDLILLGIVDGLMCASTGFSLIIQLLVHKGFISWSRSGWIIQNIWQTAFLAAFVSFGRYRGWPWTHSVFMTLHTITMLMKQHSYAFYNGYLAEVSKRKKKLEQKLQLLNDPMVMSPISPMASAITTSYFDAADLSQLSLRQKSAHTVKVDAPASFGEDVAAIASALESDAPLSFENIRSLRKLTMWEVESLTKELRGSCKLTSNFYPNNLNVSDFSNYIVFPTLVYELEYPRQDKINWFYVAEKTTATFGVIFVMIIVSTAYIYPVVQSINQMKEDGLPLRQRLSEFPWAFSDLLFPFMMEYLLSWYVIWECVLNVLAEVTRFADRGFYSDWWNSTSWDQFARDWNRPVHNFLLRFAYHSSITSFKLSRSAATLLTFFLSACVHELIMAVIFEKIRGYLLMMQMMQLPLVMLSRTKFLKGRDILGNLVFWLGIFTGPSFLCTLYLFL